MQYVAKMSQFCSLQWCTRNNSMQPFVTIPAFCLQRKFTAKFGYTKGRIFNFFPVNSCCQFFGQIDPTHNLHSSWPKIFSKAFRLGIWSRQSRKSTIYNDPWCNDPSFVNRKIIKLIQKGPKIATAVLKACWSLTFT